MFVITLLAVFSMAHQVAPLLSLDVKTVINNLDDDDFDIRQSADARLASLPRWRVEREVRRICARPGLPLEQKKRLCRLIDKWDCNDHQEAIIIFDRMFPRPVDVPCIDGAWYIVERGEYLPNKNWLTRLAHQELDPWYIKTPDDPMKFPVSYSRYRLAMRAWSIHKIQQGVPPEVIRQVLLWIKERDDVFQGRVTGKIPYPQHRP